MRKTKVPRIYSGVRSSIKWYELLSEEDPRRREKTTKWASKGWRWVK